jgi:hypothetical protein
VHVAAEARAGRVALPFGEVRMEGIIQQEALMELAGLRQKAALRRHLRKAGIPFRELNGRILTTQSAIDAAMVGRAKDQKRGPNLDAITAKSSG